MLKLYGFPLSNYYNIVKLALLEKGIPFEEINIRKTDIPDYIDKSTMGKVPAIETEQGFLTETDVILDYLEDIGEGPSLYPKDAFGKAKVKELIKHLELYIELPSRRLYPTAFFGKSNTDLEKEQSKAQLEKGLVSIKKLAKFDPYIAGPELTYADFYAQFALAIGTRVTKKVLDWDTLDGISGFKELLAILAERESFQKVFADQKAG